MTEKHTRVQPPVFLAVRTTPGKRAIAPKTDNQGGPASALPPIEKGRAGSAPPPMEKGGAESAPPLLEKGGAVSAPPPKDKGPESPAASTPLITTIMSALPEDQAQTIRGQLERLGVTLRGSPRKGSNRPVGRAPPTPRRVLRGRQVKQSGGLRQQGLPTSTGQMQPVVGGHAADGGNFPKQRQERQQMLAVLTGAGLEVSDTLSHALSLWRGGGGVADCRVMPSLLRPLTPQPSSCIATSQRSRFVTHRHAYIHTYTTGTMLPPPLHTHRPSSLVPPRYMVRSSRHSCRPGSSSGRQSR